MTEGTPSRASVPLVPPEAARPKVGDPRACIATFCALVALGVASVAVAVWSLANGGIGWDSRNDTVTALITRSIDPARTTLHQAYAAVPGTSEFYGVLVQQSADLLHRLVTGSSARLAPDDPSTYAYQATVTLVLALVSVSALAVALGVALRSKPAGAFAWSLTLSTPLWLGMSTVDYKDVPVAAGLTIVTSGFLVAFSARTPARAVAFAVPLAAVGGATTLATRAGAQLLVVGLSLSTLLAAMPLLRRAGVSRWPVYATALVPPVAGSAFVWATNPLPRISLVTWFADSSRVAAQFPWDGVIRTAGQDVRGGDLPWWYVPAWLGAQLPLLTIAALIATAAVLVGRPGRRRLRQDTRFALVLIPLLAQGLVLPVLVVASRPVLYDGIRHVLFMLPALVGLVAVAFATLYPTDRRGVVRHAVPAAAVVVVAASLLSSIHWAPYAYAYLNPVAGAQRDGWELDYWGVTGREGVRRLKALGFETVNVEPANGVGRPWGAAGRMLAAGDHGGRYVFLRYGIPPRPRDCTVLFRIERAGHTLGRGEAC
jgi:hypothetical protein